MAATECSSPGCSNRTRNPNSRCHHHQKVGPPPGGYRPNIPPPQPAVKVDTSARSRARDELERAEERLTLAALRELGELLRDTDYLHLLIVASPVHKGYHLKAVNREVGVVDGRDMDDDIPLRDALVDVLASTKHAVVRKVSTPAHELGSGVGSVGWSRDSDVALSVAALVALADGAPLEWVEAYISR